MKDFKQILAVLLVLGMLLTEPAMAASNVKPPEQKKEENRFTTWITLSLLGKNQAEIEYYFRNLDPKEMEQLRELMRFTVMDNLRRMGLKNLLYNSDDADDLAVVKRKVITEIRYVGMEHDPDLKIIIKEEFGLAL